MEKIELKITDNIVEMREIIEGLPAHTRNRLEAHLDALEDSSSYLLDYLYGQIDAINELEENMESL